MLNLTDKARKGSREAMESLLDMTKTNVMYLSTLLLGDEKAASVMVPRIYRNLWDQVLSGRINTEEDFSQGALLKTAALCKAAVAKKDNKAFRIPQNRDFIQGVGDDVQVRGEAWETVLANLPPLHRFLYVLTALCGDTPSQLARLFHTNEETVQLALQAEATNLKRILTAASRKAGKDLSLTPEEFHRALERKRAGAEIPPSVDQTILTAINALCGPIQKKIRKKRKRIVAVVVSVAAVACLTGGIVWAAVRDDSLESEETVSTASEDSVVENTESALSEVSSGESSEDETTQTETDTTAAEENVNATAYADLEIQDYGTITIALDGDAAPETVENFISLAESGFYDGLTFHRIIDGFMMQGGDPNGDGTGGSDETIPGEFSENGFENDLSHTRGAVSMARSEDYDSASSQFFIVQEDSTYLDGEYAVFGYVTEGMDIVDQICESAQPTDDNGTIPAEEQPVITSITIRDVEEEQEQAA